MHACCSKAGNIRKSAAVGALLGALAGIGGCESTLYSVRAVNTSEGMAELAVVREDDVIVASLIGGPGAEFEWSKESDVGLRLAGRTCDGAKPTGPAATVQLRPGTRTRAELVVRDGRPVWRNVTTEGDE